MILTYSSIINKTILGNERLEVFWEIQGEILSMEEICSVQTPRGTEREGLKAGERGRACWDREPGMQGWARAQAAH